MKGTGFDFWALSVGINLGIMDSVKRLRVFREALYKIELID